jgi:hypothetical protein
MRTSEARRLAELDATGKGFGVKDIYWALDHRATEISAQVWSLMERLQAVDNCHYFVACLPGRPKENYALDFSAKEALDYVPVMRTRSGVSGNEVVMPNGRMPLSAVQLPFVQLVDGRRTIREIAGHVARHGSSQVGVADLETSHATYFRISGVSICWRWP